MGRHLTLPGGDTSRTTASISLPGVNLNMAGDVHNTASGRIAIVGATFALAGAVTLTNDGAIAVGPNSNLTAGSSATIDNDGGTIENAATVTIASGATFIEGDGAETGNVVNITGGALRARGRWSLAARADRSHECQRRHRRGPDRRAQGRLELGGKHHEQRDDVPGGGEDDPPERRHVDERRADRQATGSFTLTTAISPTPSTARSTCRGDRPHRKSRDVHERRDDVHAVLRRRPSGQLEHLEQHVRQQRHVLQRDTSDRLLSQLGRRHSPHEQQHPSHRRRGRCRR